jgi:3-methylcrotonyl-CoA carboxylase alpha subunit
MAIIKIERDGKQHIVHLAGSAGDVWAFFEGQVFRRRSDERPAEAGSHEHRRRSYELTAPMPATVVKILVAPGQTVRSGDTLLLVEAMKMELPIRAPGDATVKAVNCREGEMVQPDRMLVELE